MIKLHEEKVRYLVLRVSNKSSQDAVVVENQLHFGYINKDKREDKDHFRKIIFFLVW